MNQETPSRRLRWLLGALGVLLYYGCYSLTGSGQPYRTYDSVGPVQVLAGPDEVWVFAETSRMLLVPGLVASPTNYTFDRRQEVVIFDAQGEKQRINLVQPGPTFHAKISHIYRAVDGFYLIQGESMSYQRSIFRWSKDHFELMPLEESEARLKALGLENTRLPVFDPALDRITTESGWEHLQNDRLCGEEGFDWNGYHLKVAFDEDAQGNVNVRITSQIPMRPLDVVVLSYDRKIKPISHKEREAIRGRQDPGHPKRS